MTILKQIETISISEDPTYEAISNLLQFNY